MEMRKMRVVTLNKRFSDLYSMENFFKSETETPAKESLQFTKSTKLYLDKWSK